MGNSKLENLDHKILKKIIFFLYKKIGKDNKPDLELKEIFDDIEYVLRQIGISDEYIDIDFIYTLYRLNFDLIDENGLIKEAIIIPDLKNIIQEVTVWERQWTKKKFEHRLESYSIEASEGIFRIQYNNGDVTYWDGRLTEDEITDSEVEDIEFGDIYETD